jgi:methylmalonyl-CoA/ethylmalonyl-CoA epimerase
LLTDVQFRIHHIGIAVPDVARTATFYIGRLGCVARSGIIHDPLQTAYVQFLGFPGDAALIELVSPDGPESRLAAAVQRGGGLNHVCYATPNIESACRMLRDIGMFLIHPPAPAVAFNGRPIAWFMSPERTLTELVERSAGEPADFFTFDADVADKAGTGVDTLPESFASIEPLSGVDVAQVGLEELDAERQELT